MCKKCKYVTPNHKNDQQQVVTDNESRKAQIALQTKHYVNLFLAADKERKRMKTRNNKVETTLEVADKNRKIDIIENRKKDVDKSTKNDCSETRKNDVDKITKNDCSKTRKNDVDKITKNDGSKIRKNDVDKITKNDGSKTRKNDTGETANKEYEESMESKGTQQAPISEETTNASTDPINYSQSDQTTTPHSKSIHKGKTGIQENGNGGENQMVQTNDEFKKDIRVEEAFIAEREVRNKDYLSSSNVIKVLRVLAEPQCSFNMEYSINLEEDKVEINDVTNDLSLSSCKLVPTSFIPNTNFVQLGTLYVKGTVTKKISYTPNLNEASLPKVSRVSHVKIPFRFSTEIPFPKQRQPKLSLTNKQSFKFSTSEEKKYRSSNEALQRSKIVYNEPLQFELVSAMFHELTISPTLDEETSETNLFNASCSIDITIGIMQRQNAIAKLEFDY